MPDPVLSPYGVPYPKSIGEATALSNNLYNQPLFQSTGGAPQVGQTGAGPVVGMTYPSASGGFQMAPYFTNSVFGLPGVTPNVYAPGSFPQTFMPNIAGQGLGYPGQSFMSNPYSYGGNMGGGFGVPGMGGGLGQGGGLLSRYGGMEGYLGAMGMGGGAQGIGNMGSTAMGGSAWAMPGGQYGGMGGTGGGLTGFGLSYGAGNNLIPGVGAPLYGSFAPTNQSMGSQGRTASGPTNVAQSGQYSYTPSGPYTGQTGSNGYDIVGSGGGSPGIQIAAYADGTNTIVKQPKIGVDEFAGGPLGTRPGDQRVDPIAFNPGSTLAQIMGIMGTGTLPQQLASQGAPIGGVTLTGDVAGLRPGTSTGDPALSGGGPYYLPGAQPRSLAAMGPGLPPPMGAPGAPAGGGNSIANMPQIGTVNGVPTVLNGGSNSGGSNQLNIWAGNSGQAWSNPQALYDQYRATGGTQTYDQWVQDKMFAAGGPMTGTMPGAGGTSGIGSTQLTPPIGGMGQGGGNFPPPPSTSGPFNNTPIGLSTNLLLNEIARREQLLNTSQQGLTSAINRHIGSGVEGLTKNILGDTIANPYPGSSPEQQMRERGEVFRRLSEAQQAATTQISDALSSAGFSGGEAASTVAGPKFQTSKAIADAFSALEKEFAQRRIGERAAGISMAEQGGNTLLNNVLFPQFELARFFEGRNVPELQPLLQLLGQQEALNVALATAQMGANNGNPVLNAQLQALFRGGIGY